MEPIKQQLLDAILIHVAFDGWSSTAFEAAISDSDIDPTVARTVCPRGALDLAVAYHQQGDAAMLDALEGADLEAMRIRDRVSFAIKARLMTADKEAVRRGAVLFALPQNAAEGSRLIWGTADAIWTALGDTSTDGNWYSKRAILSGVYSSVVLYWLGDDSEGHRNTWDFLDRRIDNVMQIEKVKGQMRSNPLTKGFAAGVDALMGMVKAPRTRDDLPGTYSG
ncbi:MAG: COQ9 family protein [Pseudomonadota bacterium]